MQKQKQLEHFGMCDASASVSLADNYFCVASDEDSYLRVYNSSVSGPPIDLLDLHEVLGLDSGDEESDIEASAQLGKITYWISSYGRDKKGGLQTDRHQFCGLQLSWNEKKLNLNGNGLSYRKLLPDLLKYTDLRDYTQERMQDSRIQSLAPKAVGAVNIEGLCIYGEGVLIGFRNPVTEYGALLIPLINPYELIFEGVKPSFGKSIRLDLVGLGIRSMDYHPGLKQYLIVAGPVGSEESPFKIFTWTGDIEDKAQFLCDLKDMKPESMVVYGSNLNVQILADSGSKLIGGLQCKDLAVDDERKHFDSIRLNLALK